MGSSGCTSWLPVSGAASVPEAVAAVRGGGAGWVVRAVPPGWRWQRSPAKGGSPAYLKYE